MGLTPGNRETIEMFAKGDYRLAVGQHGGAVVVFHGAFGSRCRVVYGNDSIAGCE